MAEAGGTGRVGRGVCSVKGLLSHSQSARKKAGKRAACSINTHTHTHSGGQRAERRAKQSGKAADGMRMIRVFAHLVDLFFVFGTTTIHTASMLLDAAAPIHFDYATCKKKKNKQMKNQATPAVSLHGGTAEHRQSTETQRGMKR